MEAGELVPDALVIEMLVDRISQDDAQDGFLLDGFPRNVAQAEALDAELARHGRKIDGLLVLDVDEEELVERISGRLVCANGHPWHATFNPPATRGRLRRVRRAAEPPRRRRARCRAQPLPQRVPGADRAGARPLRRARHARRPRSTARARPTTSTRACGAPSTRCDRAQVHARDRQAGAGGDDRRRDAGAAGRRGRAGRHHGRSRPDRRAPHQAARRRPDLQGLPRLPRLDLLVAERHDRARHPRPLRAAPTATSCRSTSVSPTAASSATPP